MIEILVEGEPIPAARPRFSGGRVYQPKRNSDYRQRIQTAARSVMNGQEPLKGEICAQVKLFRKYKPTAKIFGDVDNFLKNIFDAMNSVVYVDDRQIVRCVVEKHLDKVNPRAEIQVEEWGEHYERTND